MEVKEPIIPKETYEAMKEFFLKNAVPRILSQKREAKEDDKSA